MTRRRLAVPAAVLVAISCVGAGSSAPAAVNAFPFRFHKPERLVSGQALTGVACASGGVFCAAVSSGGEVLSSDEAAGTGPAFWGRTVVEQGQALTQLACSNSTVCVAVDASSRVLVQSNMSAWSAPAAIDPGHVLTGVACPSYALCVAIDDAGGVLTSSHPGGGAGAWARAQVSKHPLRRLGCGPAELCAISDGSGRLLVSTDPAGGSGAWHRFAAVPRDDRIATVSCSRESKPACAALAVDKAGRLDVFVSRRPAQQQRWHLQVGGLDHVSRGNFGRLLLSCPSSRICVAVDSARTPKLFYSKVPFGGRWQPIGFPGQSGYHGRLTAISCGGGRGIGLCLIATARGELIQGYSGH